MYLTYSIVKWFYSLLLYSSRNKVTLLSLEISIYSAYIPHELIMAYYNVTLHRHFQLFLYKQNLNMLAT